MGPIITSTVRAVISTVALAAVLTACSSGDSEAVEAAGEPATETTLQSSTPAETVAEEPATTTSTEVATSETTAPAATEATSETTAAPVDPAAAAALADYEGTWDGNFGQFVVRVIGDEAWIAYDCCEVGGARVRYVDGAIVGWYEDSTGTGRAEFRLLDDGSLDGRWHLGEEGSWSESWDMVRVDEPVVPTLDAKLADDAFFQSLRTD